MPAVRSALVVYASAHGATAQVADHVANGLIHRHLAARVAPAADDPNPTDADVVVIGIAVHEQHWMEEAEDYVIRHCADLKGVDTWLFTVGLAPALRTELARHLLPHMSDRAATAIRGIRPLGIAQFAGVLDDSTFATPERIRRHEFDGRSFVDFRDWSRIDAWAGTIATRTNAAHPTTPYSL